MRLFYRLVNNGLLESDPKSLKIRARIVNGVALSYIPVCIFYFLFFQNVGHGYLSIPMLLAPVFLLLSVILSGKRMFRLAKLLVFVIFLSITILYSLAFAQKVWIGLMIFPLTAFLYAVYDKKERKIMSVLLVISVITTVFLSFLSLEAISVKAVELNEFETVFLNVSIGVIAIISLIGILKHYEINKEKTLNELWKVVQDKKHTNEALNKQFEELNKTKSIAKIGGWTYLLKDKIIRFHSPIKLNDEKLLNEISISKMSLFKNKSHASSLANKLFGLMDGDHFELDRVYELKSGLWIRLISDKLVSNGKLIGTFQDVTQFKKEEEKVVDQLKKSEVGEFKDSFLKQMSHEIRTPLNGVVGLSDILSHQQDLSNESLALVNTIKRSAEELSKMVSEVIDATILESGNVHLEKTRNDLNQLVIELGETYQSKANEKNIQFTVENNLDHYVYLFDKVRMDQVLDNLLSNAVKFTAKGEIVFRVECKEINKSKSLIRFVVKDSGIGIREESQKQLFSKYGQSEHAKLRLNEGDVGGTGIGLYLVNNLVDLMGGRLEFTSKSGEGSEFTVEVILTQSNKVQDELNNIKGINVLLVEDKKLNQKVATLILEKLNCTVDIANNGEECIYMYNKNEGKYQLILMDLQMPIMDGETATHQLILNYKNLPPIVALTAKVISEEEENHYIAMGFHKYITKPINIEKMMYVLQSVTN